MEPTGGLVRRPKPVTLCENNHAVPSNSAEVFAQVIEREYVQEVDDEMALVMGTCRHCFSDFSCLPRSKIPADF